MSEKLDKIINWLEDYKTTNNAKGVVLGLSGGKDSTVVAMLAKKVFGDNVVAVMMPNSVQADFGDSMQIAEQLDLLSNCKIVDIGPAFNALIDGIGNIKDDLVVTEKSKTNIAPRIRMTTLYAIAQSLGYLVIGTGNFSESMIGWTTKFGDSACDFNPIKYLTKTEVVEIGIELAEEFNLDKKFITKAPGDGLTGRTDEENFGFTYDELDNYILKASKTSIDERFEKLFESSKHKRNMPLGPGDKYIF